MGSVEFDVLVIGEGLSGITAAAAARQQGARVMLASKGPGTFVLGTACVDLAGLDWGALGVRQMRMQAKWKKPSASSSI